MKLTYMTTSKMRAEEIHNIKLNKKAKIKKALKILCILNSPVYVNHVVDTYGTKALFHKGTRNPDKYSRRKYIPFFKVSQNTVLDHYLMRSKSKKIQYRLLRLIKGLYKHGYNIRAYTGYISGADSTPVNKNQEKTVLDKVTDEKNIYSKRVVTWIDKRNGKSVYKELSQTRRLIKNKLRHKKGIYVVLGRIENPHHLSKQGHIYSHAHYHFMALITDEIDFQKGLNYIKSTFKKAFLKIFGYPPSHCNDTVQQMQYDLPLYGGSFKVSKFHLTLAGKGSFYGKRYPVEFNHNPLPKFIWIPKHYVKNNVYYQKHYHEFHKNEYGFYLNQDQLSAVTVCFFVEYLCQDYRIQIKDSDDFAGSKKLNKRQKWLTYKADMDSGAHLRVINSITDKKVTKLLDSLSPQENSKVNSLHHQKVKAKPRHQKLNHQKPTITKGTKNTSNDSTVSHSEFSVISIHAYSAADRHSVKHTQHFTYQNILNFIYGLILGDLPNLVDNQLLAFNELAIQIQNQILEAEILNYLTVHSMIKPKEIKNTANLLQLWRLKPT